MAIKNAAYIQLSKYLNISFSDVKRGILASSIKSDGTIATVSETFTGIGKYFTTIKQHAEDVKLIERVLFTDLGIQKKDVFKINLTGAIIKNNSNSLLPGDILNINDVSSGRSLTFYACVISTDNNVLRTFPELPQHIGISNVTFIYRSTNIVGDENLIKTMNTEIGEIRDIETNPLYDGVITSGSPVNSEGLLQIGDIRFVVAPTQISFMTQNGYQYFPTLRTSGNPKIPSMQEVKAVNINLIFPNVDSINNQLLPLFAMYKRSPFVNIYNKDISSFYEELKDPTSDYVSVCLESINIESVPGFPNTLQASISILPFQYRAINDVFMACKTFNDVAKQQFYAKDRTEENIKEQSDNRLNNRKRSGHLSHIIKGPIGVTSNFIESEPFRAFYQSMISERKYVEDELGQVVIKSDGKPISLDILRPQKEENKLHYYIAENNHSVSFSYDYIHEDPRAFSQDLVEERRRLSQEIATGAKAMLDIISTDDETDEFGNKLESVFDYRQQFFDEMNARFRGTTGWISQFFNQYGININKEPSRRITGLCQFLFEYATVTIKVGGFNIKEYQDAAYSITSMYNENYSKDSNEGKLINILKGISVYKEQDDGKYIGNVTIDELAKLISKQIKAEVKKLSSDEKIQWAEAFNVIFNAYDNNRILDINTSDFFIKSLPTKTASFTIDNKNDIIEGWSINYANKFIPMNLNGFKYPFYQHIGSEDIQMSLSIRSLQNGRDRGLKEEFSLLNDRLQNSTRVTLMNAPNLIQHIDSRLTIDTDLGHIFNVFNIRKVIFNGSNISSIKDQPNGWNITASVTQANFTLREYQSIGKVENVTNIEDDIINLILRSEFINDTFRVNKFVISNKAMVAKLKRENSVIDQTVMDREQAIARLEEHGKDLVLGNVDEYMKTLGIPDGNEEQRHEVLRDLNMQILNFQMLNSLYKRVTTDTSGNLNKSSSDTETYNNMKMFQEGIIRIEPDDRDTLVLRKAFLEKSDDGSLRAIYSNLVYRFNEIREIESNLLIEGLKKQIKFIPQLGREFAGLSDRHANAIMTAGAFWGLSKIGIGIAGTAFVWGAGAAILVVGAVQVLDAIKTTNVKNQQIKLFQQQSDIIANTFNKIKYSYADYIASSIIRDPLIRTKLFGNRFDKQIKKSFADEGMNCYQDFDIPSRFLKGYDDPGNPAPFKFSPDFYLYDKDLSMKDKIEYAKSDINNYGNMAKIMSLMVVEDNIKLIEDLEELAPYIFDNSDSDQAIKKRIYEDIKFTSNTGSHNNQFGENDVEYLKDRIADLRRIYADISTEYRYSNDPFDVDKKKFNVLLAARTKRVIELKQLQAEIDNILTNKSKSNQAKSNILNIPKLIDKGTNRLKSFIRKDDNRQTLFKLSESSLQKIHGHIGLYFKSYIEKANIYDPKDKEALKRRKKDFNIPEFYEDSVTDDTIQAFETQVYTMLTQLNILSSAIEAWEQGERDFSDLLTQIPEMELLQWYNWRNAEDIEVRRLNTLTEFLDSDKMNKKRTSFAKLFPTFKVIFVEEDNTGIIKTRNLDDYYIYNAIQSIDVVSNKYSAGDTAVIKLNNVFNNLTDKISIMREHITKNGLDSNLDDIFLGSLDIKPGTKMIIKQGYESNDDLLPITFVGRIVEMNPGPVTEIIAQSYGAQLNHHVSKLNFGILASENEHGDIASAILDAAPGLEGLGIQDPLGVRQSRFTGRNLGQLSNNAFNRFLLSNITSRVNVGLFAGDNPRDDNLYLPINITSTVFDKMTFDWVVFDQTIWNALHEISLYHRNVCPIVKLYNNDPYSRLDELRETIIVGEKSGYYKYTDSYSLSTMNYNGIEQTIDTWNSSMRQKIADMANTVGNSKYSGPGLWSFLFGAIKAIPVGLLLGGNNTDSNADKVRSKMIEVFDLYVREGYLRKDNHPNGKNEDFIYKYTKKSADILLFLSNRTTSLVITKAIIDTLGEDVPMGIATLGLEILKEKFPGIVDSPEIKLLRVLNKIVMKGYTEQNIYDLIAFDTTDDVINIRKLFNLGKAWIDESIYDISSSFFQNFDLLNTALINLRVEHFLHVEEFNISNVGSKFSGDLRYKKIQQQHLITDSVDILNNNIILSEDFKNAVRTYYLPEPGFYTNLGSIESKKVPKLQSFTVKAFGETTDDNIRVLETFQKNIDTNWYDIRDDTHDLFQSYASTRDDGKGELISPKAHWSSLPSFVTVGISLLQREVEKMYRGTITIVGNPNIQAMDIVHIHDVINGITGAIEVEEVVHSISPNTGFTTTIVPSLITYDRNPVGLADISVIQRILSTNDILKNHYRRRSVVLGAASAALIVPGLLLSIFDPEPISKVAFGVGTAGLAATIGTSLYDFYYGAEKRQTKFLYDHMANVFGRDCINFSALYYHDKPFMCGFDGKDYSNLTTLIKHQWQGLAPIERYSTSKDPEGMWITHQGNLAEVNPAWEFAREIGYLGPFMDFIFGQTKYGNKGTNLGGPNK